MMLNLTMKLKSKGISLPTWINTDQFITNILTLEGMDLYNAFGFNDSTSCTKFISKFIPNKPKNMKFSKYLKSVLELEDDIEVELEVELEVGREDELDDEVELGIDRKSIQAKKDQQDKFAAIYKKGSFMSRKDILQLSEEEQAKYASYAESMKQAESYIVDLP
jgi:hypothetical protein